FEGFSDDWEVRKFGDLFKRRMERNNGQFDKTKWISVAKMYYQEANKVTSNNIDTRTYVLRLGDIAFEGHSNNEFKIGRFVANDIGDGVISELFPIYKHITPYDLSFWKYYINLENIMFPKLQRCIEISYTSSNKLDEKFFLKELTRVPALDEQKKIGDYLRKIDMLITLHQRKLDQVKTLKKYFLQNMFPAKGETVPKIRLKGFTGDWEQRKLGHIVGRVTRKNKDLVSNLPLTISAQYGLIDQNEFFDKRIASKDVSNYYLIHKGEFAYNKSTSTDAPWGAIKRLDRYENGVLSTLYIIFRILDENQVDSDYLASYYNTALWYKSIRMIAAEGARNHGLLNIAPDDFFETTLMIPRDIAEQKKIGAYLKNLDDLITLHQRKLDQLQTLKKFMLQNLFI
ncbi:restriction endonuclease subunit S, partial [Megasphaera massiliensis]|uniref:restriction endonuclease subunit S n=1 Tax=Megasphaera massiliensis TaxID=1232428 RepID=UPI003AF10E64